MFENRRWLIIPTNITGSINFDEVIESGPESLRVSVDGSKTFVKYEIHIVNEQIIYETINPENGENMTTIVEVGIYGRPSIYSSEHEELTYQQITNLLLTPEWNKPFPILD